MAQCDGCDELENEVERLEDEVKVLRKSHQTLLPLVQTNPEWKCTYGYLGKDGKPLPTMGHCPLGFPGCACADDRLMGEIDEAKRIYDKLKIDKLTVRITTDGNRHDMEITGLDFDMNIEFQADEIEVIDERPASTIPALPYEPADAD